MLLGRQSSSRELQTWKQTLQPSVVVMSTVFLVQVSCLAGPATAAVVSLLSVWRSREHNSFSQHSCRAWPMKRKDRGQEDEGRQPARVPQTHDLHSSLCSHSSPFSRPASSHFMLRSAENALPPCVICMRTSHTSFTAHRNLFIPIYFRGACLCEPVEPWEPYSRVGWTPCFHSRQGSLAQDVPPGECQCFVSCLFVPGLHRVTSPQSPSFTSTGVPLSWCRCQCGDMSAA